MSFTRRLLSIVGVLFAVGVIAAGPVRAAEREAAAKKEAPAAAKASPEERIEALEETIRILEARLREVEGRDSPAKPADTRAAAPADGPSAAPTAPPAPPADASAAAAPPAPGFFDKVEFSGFVDGYYGYNFNRPASRKNQLRNFDFNHNQFSLNLVELALEKKADPFGFRLDLGFGDTTKWVHGTEPGGTDVYQYLQQAYGSFKAPIGKGLTIDFGKFVTGMGAEVIESHLNYNYSRSLLFAWAIPYYHFGARVTYPFSDKVTAGIHVVNGWNNVVDNNTGKSVGFMVSLTPHKRVSIIQNYMVGAEQADNNRDKRQMFDTVVTLTAHDKAVFLLNYDYGMDRLLGERVRWHGFAGAARFQLTPVFAFSPRLEWFGDAQGFSTGAIQNLKEATMTAEFKVRGGLLMRAEYRRDWSDIPFFEKREGLFSKSQTTATFGLIYVLGQER